MRNDLIQVRSGTAAEWSAASPVLALGELGFVTDTNTLKVGDGSTAFGSLSAIGGGGGGSGNATLIYGGITTTTNDTQTYAAITGSSVTVEAGKTYKIEWHLRTYSASGTTGLRLQRALGGGAAGNIIYNTTIVPNSNTTLLSRSSREGTIDDALGLGNSASSTGASAAAFVYCLFECTTGGTIGLEMASEANSNLVTVDGDGSGWAAVVCDT